MSSTKQLVVLAALISGCVAPGGEEPTTEDAQAVTFKTTTYAAEIANNTSASSLFKALANGDATPGNVSNVSIRKLLPANFKGKILAHWMPWWSCSGSTIHCDGVHTAPNLDVHYSTEDPAQLKSTIEDMIRRGYDGIMIAEANSGTNKTASTLAMAKAFKDYPDFLFSISENHLKAQDDPVGHLKTDMAFAKTNYFGMTNYLKIDDRPVVYVFDDAGLDWDAMSNASAAIPGHPFFIIDSVNSADSKVGGFHWFGIHGETTYSSSDILAIESTFLKTVKAKPDNIYSGSFYKGFNDVMVDSVAGWGLHRIVDQACGQTFVNSLEAYGTYLSASSANLPLIQNATWNDYEEGTELETGIDNCGTPTAKVSGTVITPSVDFTSGGSLTTVDHYTVFVSTDGNNLTDVADDLAVGDSVDLKTSGLAPGTYQLFIKMVGKSHIINRMSPELKVTIPGSTKASIVVSSPAAGAHVSSPVELALATHESFTVSRIQVWDAGTKIVDVANQASLDTTLKLAAGNHELVINIQDSSLTTKDTLDWSFAVE